MTRVPCPSEAAERFNRQQEEAAESEDRWHAFQGGWEAGYRAGYLIAALAVDPLDPVLSAALRHALEKYPPPPPPAAVWRTYCAASEGGEP